MSTMMCRGIRGATTADANTKEAIVQATKELLQTLATTNGVQEDQVASILFTTTQDLTAEFPAVAARQMGWTNAPLLCGHEMDVPDGTPSVIRVLMLVNTSKRAQDIFHKYLKGAQHLRERGTAL